MIATIRKIGAHDRPRAARTMSAVALGSDDPGSELLPESRDAGASAMLPAAVSPGDDGDVDGASVIDEPGGLEIRLAARTRCAGTWPRRVAIRSPGSAPDAP